jgi:glycosyltransferase involved in cell wall biosynthesis
MAKILIDARESGTSTGRYIDKLLENLHALKSGDNFTVLTKKHRIEAVKKIAPSFEVVESNYKEFTFSEQFRYVWQLYGIKNDLVHFGMAHQPVLYFGDCVTTVHDLTTARFRNPAKNFLVFKFKQLVYKLVIKRAAKKSKHIIVPSEYVKKDLTSSTGIDPSKISVTYEAADKIRVSAEPIPKLKSANFLLYVGRPFPHKNLWRLIEAFELLKQTHPNLKLVLAGKKDLQYERHEKKVIKKGINGVIFTGFVSEGNLRWLYENCQAYVFPSLSEGFGLPALEAMAHGAPVVSSNATCLPEIYGQAAYYFDPLDVADMATKINDVLSEDKLRSKLVAVGQKQAAKYSWERMAKQTIDIYQRALKK